MSYTIEHIHLDQCGSTQKELAERDPKSKTLLISTSKQTHGHGRRGSAWLQTESGLAFSFNLSPQKVVTLTPLELGVHVVEFFKECYGVELFLKWPNDILNSRGEKVGGIICQSHGDQLLAGIGINLLSSLAIEHIPQPCGGIFIQEPDNLEQFKESMPYRLVERIIENRKDQEVTAKTWNLLCFHLNQEVRIVDGAEKKEGTFVGIDEFGRAILKDSQNNDFAVSTGSLFFH